MRVSDGQRLREEWGRKYPAPRDETAWKKFAREYTNTVEGWLDKGSGECHFRERRWCDYLRDRLHYFQDQKYFLSCWAIMPNHCHAVIRPFDGFSLEVLLGAIKGVMARHINAALGRTGALREEESYDTIVRDEESRAREPNGFSSLDSSRMGGRGVEVPGRIEYLDEWNTT